MGDDSSDHEAPTRRDYMKYGGAVVAGGLLAGCAGQSDSESTPTETSAEPTTGSQTDTTAATETTQQSWTVRMAPRTEVTFESVPEEVVVYRADYADMLISLGHGDAIAGMQDTQSLPSDMLAELDGVSVDADSITPLRQDGEYDKEILYDIDADLHLIDPNNAKNYLKLDEADIAEIETNIAPWLGSFIRRPQESIGPNYPHYTLYQAFDRVSRAFQRPKRYDALSKMHTEMLSGIAEKRPSKEERPSVGLAYLIPGDSYVESGVFYLNNAEQPGMAMKQYRDLGVENVWAKAGVSMEGQVGYEALLEADPDVLIAHNAFGYTDSIADFQERVVDVMADDELGSQLTAIQNGRVYRGGKNVQGPLINFFQTEIAAKQLYPETFGEWMGLGETPESEQLFDRGRLSAIINGNFDEE